MILFVVLAAVVCILLAPNFDLEPSSLRFTRIARLFWTAVMTALVAIALQAVAGWLSETHRPEDSPAPLFPLLDLVCARLC